MEADSRKLGEKLSGSKKSGTSEDGSMTERESTIESPVESIPDQKPKKLRKEKASDGKPEKEGQAKKEKGRPKEKDPSKGLCRPLKFEIQKLIQLISRSLKEIQKNQANRQ
jgi:hypothetical protein